MNNINCVCVSAFFFNLSSYVHPRVKKEHLYAILFTLFLCSSLFVILSQHLNHLPVVSIKTGLVLKLMLILCPLLWSISLNASTFLTTQLIRK